MKNQLKMMIKVALSVLMVGGVSVNAMDLSRLNLNAIAQEAQNLAASANVNLADVQGSINRLAEIAKNKINALPNIVLGYDISQLKQGKIDATTAQFIKQAAAESDMALRRVTPLLRNFPMVIAILNDIVKPALENPAELAAAFGIKASEQVVIPEPIKAAFISGINFLNNNEAAATQVAQRIGVLTSHLSEVLTRIQSQDLTKLTPENARALFATIEADVRALAPAIIEFVRAHGPELLAIANQVLAMNLNKDLA